MNGSPGMFGCDLMQILYNGDVNADYYVGWKDQVATKAGYVLSLINAGITAQSAFISIETNNTQAWTTV
jgi:5,10-methylene-tetrahydrofolate dehydrogenase/methenyl tetrahydrofolate cyclohydrolase